MKINKTLSINGELKQLVSEDITLHLSWHGKASFIINDTVESKGEVLFKVGFAHANNLHSYFVGGVETCIEVAPGKWQVIAKEISAAFDFTYPIALRHVTLKQVAEQLSANSGVSFVVPDATYANNKIPYFYHTGTITQQLAAMAKAFDIPDYMWQIQGDGRCYVGSYADSFWPEKSISITAQQAIKIEGNGITLPLVPSLRPGANVNGKRIREVKLAGAQMVAKW